MSEKKKEPSKLQEFRDKVSSFYSNQPSLMGQLRAMGREGAKDLADAVLHAFPDSQRLHDEPGTPLSPTQAQVTKDMGNVYGFKKAFESYAARGNVHGQEKDKAQEKGKDQGLEM